MKLIDKDVLVAVIEKCYNECLKKAKITDSDYWNAKADAYRNVLVILDDTLEVIEIGVDLGDHKGDKSAKYIIDTNTLEVKEVDDEPKCRIFPRPIECYSTCKECPWLATNNKAQKGK